jgi:hypothetical protein
VHHNPSNGPPWMGDGVDRRAPGCGGALNRVGPPATLGHVSLSVGAKNGGEEHGGPVLGLIGVQAAV